MTEAPKPSTRRASFYQKGIHMSAAILGGQTILVPASIVRGAADVLRISVQILQDDLTAYPDEWYSGWTAALTLRKRHGNERVLYVDGLSVTGEPLTQRLVMDVPFLRANTLRFPIGDNTVEGSIRIYKGDESRYPVQFDFSVLEDFA